MFRLRYSVLVGLVVLIVAVAGAGSSVARAPDVSAAPAAQGPVVEKGQRFRPTPTPGPIQINDMAAEPVVVLNGGGSALDGATLKVTNPNRYQWGVAATFTNRGGWHTAFFENQGPGGNLFLSNLGDDSGAGGGDFITAKGKTNRTQFAVHSNGEVASNAGFTTPAGDYAEMLPAVPGLAPGDVLAIGPDGRLVRTTEANQLTVAGVYSTAPGFVGGHSVDGAPAGAVPLAITGVVPVKASAENGPIRPGDLLVAAATPGHAMKAPANPAPGAVIGKALEPLDHGTGIIQVLVAVF